MEILLYGVGNDIIDKQIKKIMKEHEEYLLNELRELEIEIRYEAIQSAYYTLLETNTRDLEVFDLYDKREREYYNNYFKKK